MTARSSKTVFAKGGLKSCLWGLVEFFGSFLLLPDVGLTGLFYGCFVLRSGAPGSQENYFMYTVARFINIILMLLCLCVLVLDSLLCVC